MISLNQSIMRLFIATLIITVISESVGSISIHLGSVAISLLPMLYAVILGILLSPDLLGRLIRPLGHLLTYQTCEDANEIVMIALLILGVGYGNLIAGNAGAVLNAGPALIFQELGNLLSVIIALPLAMLLGMRREAIGACSSISREPSLGVIGGRFGLNSPEGIGVMGTYIVGTIIGTPFFSVIPSLGLLLGFNPLSLAAACGLGSGSMMAACTSAIAASSPPDMAQKILSYGAGANMVAGLTGTYILALIGLPLAGVMYKVMVKVLPRKTENAAITLDSGESVKRPKLAFKERWTNYLKISVLSIILVLIGQRVGSGAPITTAIPGAVITLVIMFTALYIKENIPSSIPLPAFVWAILISFLLMAPFSPVGSTIHHYVSAIGFLPTTTPLLAFAGLSAGNKLSAFKKLGWVIIVASLVTFVFVYLGGATVAQTILSSLHII